VKRILFVCTGNVFRSAAAEKLFNFIVAREGVPAVASSAGLKAARGAGLSKTAARFLSSRGVTELAHSPSPVDQLKIINADLVIAMERWQYHFLTDNFPAHSFKFRLLTSFSSDPALRNTDVPDPVSGEDAVAAQALAMIEDCVGGLARTLKG